MSRSQSRFFTLLEFLGVLWLGLLALVGSAHALSSGDIYSDQAIIYRRSDLPAVRTLFGAAHGATAENPSALLYPLWSRIKSYYNTYSGDASANVNRSYGCVCYAVTTEDATALARAKAFLEAMHDQGIANTSSSAGRVGGWPYAPSGCGGCPPCTTPETGKKQHDAEGAISGDLSAFPVCVRMMQPYLADTTIIRYRRIFHYAHAPKGCVSTDGDTNGEYYKSTCNRVNWEFGCAGDSASLGEIADLNTNYTFFQGCLECVLALGLDGPPDQYTDKRFANLLMAHWMFRTCTTLVDAFTSERDFFANAGNAWILRLNPKYASISNVSNLYWEPGTSKASSSYSDAALFFSYAGACGNDAALSFFLDGVSQGLFPGTNQSVAPKCFLPAVFLANAGITSNPYPVGYWQTAFPREQVVTGPAWYLYRENLSLSTTGPFSGVRAQFWGNPISLGAFANCGTYCIEFGNSNQVARGFRRYVDNDFHFFPVAAQTWGYNCLEIVNSNLPGVGQFSHYTHDQDQHADGDCADEAADLVPNSGSQIQGDRGTVFTECYTGSTDNNPEHRGEVIEQTVDSRFFSQCLDLTDAYWSGSQSSTYRWVYFAKPEWVGSNQAFWIVVDQTVPLSGTTQLVSYVHVPNTLHADGSLTRLAGAIAADSIGVDWDGNLYKGDTAQGGRYRSTNTTRLWSKNSPGQTVLFPLYLEGNSGASEYQEIVGGPNNLGTGANGSWFNKWQYCSSTYTSGITSYEFFRNLGGVWKNLTPGTPDRLASCAECVPSSGWYPYLAGGSSFYKVIGSVDRNERITGPANVGPGSAGCDYSLRLYVDSPQAGQWSTLAYGGWVGSEAVSRDNLPTMSFSQDGSTLAIGFVSQGNNYGVVRSLPKVGGSLPTTMSWTNPFGDEGADWSLPFLLPSQTYNLTVDGSANISITTNSSGVGFFRNVTNGVTTFTLTLATSATGACCQPDGTCAVTAPGSCTGEYLGDGTNCSPNNCPQPRGSCCFADGHCEFRRFDYCIPNGGDWGGYGTDCDPNPCTQPTGACCLENGTCQIKNADDCDALSGNPVYQGDDTVCSPNPCPQPLNLGACCLATLGCNDLTLSDCQTAGGVFLGAGTSCSDNPTPTCYSQNNRACCLPTGYCVVMTEGNCVQANGTWYSSSATCSLSCLDAPYGACCASDGSCTYTIETACTDASGIYIGAGVQCVPNPCQAFTDGACCLGSVCITTTESGCTDFNGLFIGEGTYCSDLPCPGLDVGACCFPSGYCSQVIEVDCTAAEGVWQGSSEPCIPDPCPFHIGTGGSVGRQLGKKSWPAGVHK